MTLTEFLLARLDEDEAVARAAVTQEGEATWYVAPVHTAPRITRVRTSRDNVPVALVEGIEKIHDDTHLSEHIARHDPARVLAEVEAKRRIVARLADESSRRYDYDTLRLLALPYADHPDYDEAWRP